MDLVLNDCSIVGQFKNYEEFEEYFISVLNAVFEVIDEKKMTLYKMSSLLNCRIIGDFTLAQVLAAISNSAVAAVLRRRIIHIMSNPYLDNESKTVPGIAYEYPGKTEEPNCFTEAIERRLPLLSFPEQKYSDSFFACRRNGEQFNIHNIKDVKDLLDVYLTEENKDIIYILRKYPFPKKVNFAELNGRCYAEKALLENELSYEDFHKIVKQIPDLIDDKLHGRKTHRWDSIEGKINEYRVTVSGSREFRLFFLWEEEIVFLNGFIKKTPATPKAEKQKAKDIVKEYNA